MDFVLVSCPLKSPKFNSTREQADEGSRPMLGVNCSCFSLREAFGDARLAERSRTVPPNFYSFMKQLKFRTFIIAMLLASAMGVSAEKVETIVGDLKYEIDTETKEASVIKGDYSGLYFVTIPEKIAVEGVDYAVTSIGDYAFNRVSKLTSVTLPNSVKSIGNGGFYYCENLTAVSLGSSLTSIGENAFYHCNISAISLPESLETIGKDAFNSNSIVTLTIPNSVKTLGESAFHSCDNLSEVIIGNSVEIIESGTFRYCRNLCKVTIGQKVKTIGTYAFSDCTLLSSIEFGEAVQKIEDHAFDGCSNLGSITLPNTLVGIGDGAFSNTGLTSVKIPSSVAQIGTLAFNCEALKAITVDINNPSFSDIDGVLCNKTKKILYHYPNAKGSDYEIPNTIVKIERYAIYNCKNLISVTIPASVSSIASKVFGYCNSLKKITCLRTSPISVGFSDLDQSNITLFVPKESVDAYKNASDWKYFIIKAIGSVAEDLSLNNSELTLNEGETYQLTYTVLPETADAPTVEWTSSNPEIATVDVNGKVTAIALGSTTITVKTTDGTDISATCNVTVQESPNTDITTMDDVIYLEHAKALTGKSVTLSLKMKHEMKVSGFQFNMVLPENFTIENISRGEGIKAMNDDDEYIFTFNNSEKEDGSRFFLCYSTTNTAMPEGDIEIAKVVVNVPEGIEPGEYGVILKNAELAYGTEKKVIDYVKGSISVTDYIIGDANNDGIISVVDITAIGQYLLDGDKTNINLAAADANGDGVVSVADITTIAVMILNAENTGVNEGIIEGNEQLK